jgi:oxygen-independent coproporphyrinogen-3 oxidase
LLAGNRFAFGSNMSDSFFDPDLIRRYNINGPRYTSYPTADQFRDGDWIDGYESALIKTNIRALSLYLHIPFCSTICYYCACNKINTANLQRADSYVQRLVREMALHSQRIDRPHLVEQLHFGGGTPTFLSETQFEVIFEAMADYFNLADEESRDFSVEIDPRGLSTRRIDHLAQLGINRISIGVQDFDPQVQVAVNRIQSVDETRAIINAARDNNIRSINIDLINGLPKQTLKGFSKTLKQVIDLGPDRLSLYSYAHLPHRFKTQKQINPNDLPSAETKLQLLGTAIELLGDAGYEYVGMDHFAKSSDSLINAQQQGTLHRNFQGYTTHGHCELVGLGVSSIGNVGPVYVQNAKTLHEYYQAVDAGELAIVRGFESNDQDEIIGQVIQDLMCKFAVSFDDFRNRSGAAFMDYFAEQWPELLRFQKDGLLRIDSDKITVTGQGRYLVRNICMTFDAYLRNDTEKFSKAI